MYHRSRQIKKIIFTYITAFTTHTLIMRKEGVPMFWTRPLKFNRTFIVRLSYLYRSFIVLIFHTPYAECIILVVNEVDKHVAVTVCHVAMGLHTAGTGRRPQIGGASQILISCGNDVVAARRSQVKARGVGTRIEKPVIG